MTDPIPIDEFERRPKQQRQELRPSLATYTAADYASRDVPAREWIAADLIPARKVTLLMGDGGTGKSTIALQLAAAMSTGGRWLGLPVTSGPVLFISAEDDADELHRRLADICLAHGIAMAALDRLYIADMTEADTILSEFPGQRCIETPAMEVLRAKVGEIEPTLLIIDPLADYFGGDEIKKAHVIPFIGMFRRLCSAYGTTVLLLGHPSVSGMASGSGTSGNVGWSNSVRSRLYFEKPRAKDGDADFDPDLRILTAKKTNYGPAGIEIKLRWQGGVFTATETKRPDRFSRIAAENAADTKFMELLNRFSTAGRIVSDMPGRNYAPNLFAQDPAASGTAMPGFKSAMARLFSAGRLKVEEEGPASRRKRKIAGVPE